MKTLTSLIILTMVINTGCTQTSSYAKFINSFPEVNRSTILRLGVVVGTGPKMTKEEAMKFVYHNDSTKLYCKQKIFNMETEKVEGISTELYLPQKCLQIKTSKFILMGYSTFECQDPNKLLKQFLALNIINASNYQVTDSLLVYTGNDYGWEITGLINPQNNKIFILKETGKRTSNAQAFIYRINDAFQFEIEKQQSNIEGMSDDLEKNVKLLGWEQAFLN